MPLPKTPGRITVLLQNFGDGGSFRRYRTVVRRKAVGNFCNAAHMNAVVITSGQQRRTRRRTQRRGMKLIVFQTRCRNLVDAGRWNRPTKGAAGAKTYVVQHHQQNIRRPCGFFV